ncbi:MAG: MATE family efflux transporter [Clostridium sp.]|nr:MATE family efflux transporter [Clostridium sp.]
MGVMPENKLLLNMAVPMMLSMLVQALYNVVDSIFVSKLSQDALNAVSLAFPMQNLMIAVGAGTAVGINALLSRSLGQKDQDRADKTAMNGILLALISAVVFTVVGLFGARLFFSIQTDIQGIVDYGTDYLTVICGCCIGIFAQVTFERLLQSTGRTFYSMITQGTGAIINIILDPILIFGLFGLPRMEVMGAAVATVIGQCVAALLAIFFNIKCNPDINLSWKGLRPDKDIIRGIYSVGLPSIAMQSIGSIMVFGMNKILLGFTDTATAVFGIYFKLQSFIFMPIFGLNSGVIPIVAYNYGARKPARIMKTYKLAIGYAIAIMCVGVVIFQTVPELLLALFSESGGSADELIAVGVPALRIISVHFPVAGFCIITGAMFQALGHGVLSLVNSIIRQLVVLLPAALILSLLGGLNAIWFSFLFAEVSSMILSTIFIRRVYKNQIEPLFQGK